MPHASLLEVLPKVDQTDAATTSFCLSAPAKIILFDIKRRWNEHFEIFVDTSYVTHADMKSHTGILMKIIKGSIISK